MPGQAGQRLDAAYGGGVFQTRGGYLFAAHYLPRGSQAITDVIGGQLALMAVNALGVQPHVKRGKLKVHTVLSTNRSAIFPGVPTIWYGWWRLPQHPRSSHPIACRCPESPANKEKHDRMTQVGGEVLSGSLEMFAALIRSERLRYEKPVR